MPAATAVAYARPFRSATFGAVGAAVSLVVLAMAAYMILQSGKRLAEPNEKQNENLPQGAKIGETNERYEP